MTQRTLTVLAEDTVNRRGLLAEHGLAFWLEVDGTNILFDTGQGMVLGHNARRLGVRLEQADAIVLSHGHYDHTGGLAEARQAAPAAPVYAHPAAVHPKYARNPDGTTREVGFLGGEDFTWVTGPTEVTGGLFLTGPVPRTNDFEDTGGDFCLDPAGTRPDDLPDDQAAFLPTSSGTTVILGCAHAGIINTLTYVRDLTDGQPIRTLVGGMHLLHASPERLDRTVVELRRLGVRQFFPCHCTGVAAILRLWAEFPGACAPCPVGTILDLGRS